MCHKIKKIYQKLRNLSALVDFLRNIFLLPKAIKYIYKTLLVMFAFLTAYKQFFQEKIYDIFQTKILEYYIILKVWQVLLWLFVLMTIVITLIYLFRKRKQKNILSQSEDINLESYLNYNWRWGRDPVGKVIIDDMPYCINHRKRFKRKQYQEYTCPEPNYGEGIVSVHYRDIIDNVKKYIRDKYENY